MRRTCGQKYRDEDYETQQREWLHDLHAACVEDAPQLHWDDIMSALADWFRKKGAGEDAVAV